MLVFQEATDGLVLIFRLLDLEGKTDPYSCGLVANRLNRYNPRKEKPWTYSYIRNIYQGKQPPSRYISPAIEKLYNYLIKPPKPPRQRYRLTIETEDETEYKQFKSLTMERRLIAFRNEYRKGVL